MQHLYERVSYLKGLSEGLGISDETKEGKLLLHIVDVLEDLADSIVEISEEQEDLKEYMDAMDEEIAEMEDNFDEDGFHYVELVCPHCGETIELDEDLLCDEDVEIVCPSCHKTIDSCDSCPDGCSEDN